MYQTSIPLFTCFDHIIQLHQDSVLSYEGHIHHVKDRRLKGLYQRILMCRKGMQQEIQQLLFTIYQQPIHANGTLLGKLHRLFEHFKNYFTNTDPIIISKEIKRSENILIESYKDALRDITDHKTKLFLIRHVNQIENDLKQVDLLTIKVASH